MNRLFLVAALAFAFAGPALAEDTVIVQGSGTSGQVDYTYAAYQKSNDLVWAKATAHVNGIDNSGDGPKRPIDYRYKTNDIDLPNDETITITGFHTYGPGMNYAVRTKNTVPNPFHSEGGGEVSASTSNSQVR